MFAYDYPLLGLFWTMMWWFLWIAWIMLLFHVIVDIFRNSGLGGFAKAFWLLFVVIVPWLGVLIYLIAQGRSMAERSNQRAADNEAAFRSYVQETASSGGGSADELAKLADLRDRGVLSEAEFQQQKAKLMA